MQSTDQLIARKAWLERQHASVCAALRARGVDLGVPPAEADQAPAKKTPARKATGKAAAEDSKAVDTPPEK